MKNRQMFGLVTVFSALTIVFGSVLLMNNNKLNEIGAKAGVNSYSVTFNNTVFNQSSLTTTYQQNVVQQFGEDKQVMNYFLAKKDGDNNLVLAPLGKLFNYSSSASYNGRITNITSVTVSYSGGSLFVQEGIGGDATQYTDPVALASGTELALATNPNFIMISNSKAETTITSMTVKYSCSEAGFTVNRLGEKYNGKSSSGDVYVLSRDGENVSIGEQNGTIDVDQTGHFTITLSEGAIVYTGSVSSDYRTLTFTGKSGANSESAPTIAEMNRIYVFDDFENYADRGTGFTSDATSIFTASNLRGRYYADAASGSGATWVSGSGFKIPSTSNYLNISTGLVHGGSKAMLLQGQKAGWVRLWNNDIFNQNQHFNFGRGNKLSFWIHSGRNNPDGTGVNSSNVKIRAQVYYENFVITDSNRNSTTYGTGTKATVGCDGEGNVTINSGSGWNEVIINIDPTKTVYGLNIMINNSGLSTDYVFMPIDDITVYTEPVFEPTKKYDESATSFTKTYHGNVTLGNALASLDFTVKVGLGANGYVYAYAGADMQPTKYTVNGNQIAIETTGSVDLSKYGLGTKTFGTWTGTLSNSNKTITIQKDDITGSITDVIKSNTITLNEDNVVATGNEGTAGLQTIFDKQKNPSGSWVADDTADGISQTTNYCIEGSNSIYLKPNGTIRIIVKPSILEAQSATFASVSFWYYAPAGTNYTIRLYSYNGYNPVGSDYDMPSQKVTDGTDEQSGWKYINCGLDSSYGKSFAIYIQSTSYPSIIDYITYF